VASALRAEVKHAEIAVLQSELADQQRRTHSDVGKVVTVTVSGLGDLYACVNVFMQSAVVPDLSNVLFYSQVSVFLAGPCVL
jgi:hypothetical protein